MRFKEKNQIQGESLNLRSISHYVIPREGFVVAVVDDAFIPATALPNKPIMFLFITIK